MTPVGALLLRLMDDVDPATGLPEALCRLAVTVLPVTGASLTVTDRAGGSQLVVGSDERAVAVGRLPFALGEGPGREALLGGRMVLQPDLALTGPGRWPRYAAAALSLDVRAVFSLPLRIGGILLGVLDLVADAATDLLDDGLTGALVVADAAVVVVLHLEAGDDDPAGAMVDAFRFSSEVHQATGMVSVQARTSLAEALLLLRGRAYVEGRSIADVAHDVVDRSVRFG